MTLDASTEQFETLSAYRTVFPTDREFVVIESGVREQDSVDESGDLLGEWDILFYPYDAADTPWSSGNVLARRVHERDRFSLTASAGDDVHPVVMVAAVADLTAGRALWQRTLEHSTFEASLVDLLSETDYEAEQINQRNPTP
ncbi:hypothetical protein [Williamsia deligens]|uniref:Uncharacterized protein n=1 Tax=Williamsia deligens TaxID=321325 RepID=A0ABW3G6A3_9NOCA|nr:hypothetical protein [Williamsia deligens]MCP2193637.1 hypothetical protein [Williamsia deligens]